MAKSLDLELAATTKIYGETIAVDAINITCCTELGDSLTDAACSISPSSSRNSTIPILGLIIV